MMDRVCFVGLFDDEVKIMLEAMNEVTLCFHLGIYQSNSG